MSKSNFLPNISFFSTWDICSAIIVLVVGYILILNSAKSFNSNKIRAISLYTWHTLFCFAYIFTTTKIGGDAIWYYTSSLKYFREFEFGTNSTQIFTGIFTQGFGLTYISTFLVFNILGSYGLLAVDASLRHATKNKSGFVKSLSLIVVLIPSMSYWSSAIGKDSIQFMATGFLLWSCIDFKNRNKMFFISLVIMFMVRPHICSLAILSFALSVFLMNSLTISKKIIYLSFCLVSLIFVLPFAMNYVGLGNSISLGNLMSYIEQRQGYNLGGGSSLDIKEMNLLYQLFTYLFRPLPYEAHNAFAFLSSIDNFLLLMVFILSLSSVIFLKRQKFTLMHSKENRLFLLIFSLGTLLILSLTTANLGISVRQKWMVMPIFLYFMFLFISVRWSKDFIIKRV